MTMLLHFCLGGACPDFSIEGLMRRMKESPTRIFFCLEEFRAFYGMFGRYNKKEGGGEADKALILKAFNCGTYQRVLSEKTLHIPNTGMAVCGWSQPADIAKFLCSDPSVSGLLARFITLAPTCKAMEYMNIANMPETEGIRQMLSDQASMTPEVVASSGVTFKKWLESCLFAKVSL
jgi:hypothetical protein